MVSQLCSIMSKSFPFTSVTGWIISSGKCCRVIFITSRWRCQEVCESFIFSSWFRTIWCPCRGNCFPDKNKIKSKMCKKNMTSHVWFHWLKSTTAHKCHKQGEDCGISVLWVNISTGRSTLNQFYNIFIFEPAGTCNRKLVCYHFSVTVFIWASLIQCLTFNYKIQVQSQILIQPSSDLSNIVQLAMFSSHIFSSIYSLIN